jgi:hypothetical protein
VLVAEEGDHYASYLSINGREGGREAMYLLSEEKILRKLFGENLFLRAEKRSGEGEERDKRSSELWRSLGPQRERCCRESRSRSSDAGQGSVSFALCRLASWRQSQ